MAVGQSLRSLQHASASTSPTENVDRYVRIPVDMSIL